MITNHLNRFTKISFISITLYLFGYYICNGQDYSGIWEGELYQYYDTFNIKLEIQQKGCSITGITYISDKEGNLGEISLKGKVKDDGLIFKDQEIINSKVLSSSYPRRWCLKEVNLEFGLLYGREILAGQWSGLWAEDNLSPCNPGTIHLKKQLKIRKLKAGKRVEVSTKELVIEVSDFRRQDGDSITLIFNGQEILAKHLLTKKAYKIKLKIDERLESNSLVLYAENLGLEPPNTAYVTIKSGRHKKSFFMQSDLSESDVIYLISK